MLRDDFFAGLIAALRLEGVEFIETRDNVHHEHFRKVAGLLEDLSRKNEPGTDELPGLFRPTVATGLYGEWDDALLSLQEGFGSSPNPSYLGLKLVLTESEARDVLVDFSPQAQAVLDRLAIAYKNGDSAQNGDSAPKTQPAYAAPTA